ncbi:MAG: hypothetical protein IJE89_04260 [Bacilli bacterium]|nr:hypothetical protein [Bacilli bacterium]
MLIKKSNVFGVLLVSLFVFTLSLGNVKADEYENYFGIKITSNEYNTLLNLGFSEDEIYYMDETTYNENKNLDASLVSQNEKYYKSIYTNLNGESTFIEVTKEEYENQSSGNAPRTTIETTYKKMVSTISQNGTKYRYKNSLTWKNMPSKRSYDIIGIGFDDDVYINSSVYLTTYYCYSSGDCVTDSSYYNKQKTSTGGSAVFKLPSDSIISLASTLYYDVSKNNSNTITRLDMYADYAHATSTITGSNASNHYISTSGIELTSSNVSYYDDIPTAHSVWSGSW